MEKDTTLEKSRYNFSNVLIKSPKEPEELQEVFNLFYGVCEERNWPAGDLFKLYSQSSVFWAGYRQGRIVCAVQLVLDSPLGFPITKPEAWPDLHILRGHGLKPAEVAMVAVDKQERGSALLFIPLYIHLYHFSKRTGITHWYAIIDRVIARLYKRLNLFFVQIGEEKIYWGEPCFPAVLAMADLERELEQNRPDLWQLVKEYAPD